MITVFIPPKSSEKARERVRNLFETEIIKICKFYKRIKLPNPDDEILAKSCIVIYTSLKQAFSQTLHEKDVQHVTFHSVKLQFLFFFLLISMSNGISLPHRNDDEDYVDGHGDTKITYAKLFNNAIFHFSLSTKSKEPCKGCILPEIFSEALSHLVPITRLAAGGHGSRSFSFIRSKFNL